MDRIFHKHVFFIDIVTIMVFALIGLWALMHHNLLSGVVGLAMIVLAALTVERAVHTVYLLTSDKRLVIDGGRLSRRIVVPLSEIREVKRVEGRLLLKPYIAVEWGDGHVVSVHPDNEDGFIREIERRMASASVADDTDADGE